MYFIKLTNMTSTIAPLVSFRYRLRQALSRCSGFFDPVFPKTPGTQTVNLYAILIFLTIIAFLQVFTINLHGAFYIIYRFHYKIYNHN